MTKSEWDKWEYELACGHIETINELETKLKSKELKVYQFYEELEKVLLKENVVEGTALSTEEIGRKSYEALRDSKDTESQETIAEIFKSWKKKILEITQGRE